MSANKLNALIVFCEGAHDIAFLSKIFWGMNFQPDKRKLPEYPAPFSLLFEQGVAKYVAEDLGLHMGDKYFLPDKVFSKNSDIVFLFSTGGKDKFQKVQEFLDDLMLFIEDIDGSDFSYNADSVGSINQTINHYKYLFFYDADSLGLEAICEDLSSKFSLIKNWGSAQWLSHQDHSFAAIDNNRALYVLGETPQKGTLEDILYPLFAEKNPAQLQNAGIAVNSLFSWEINDNQCPVALESKRRKSIITLIGQRDDPGESMARVLNNRGLYVTNFQEHDLIKPIKNFLTYFLSQ
jgi:hypothetical protein